MVKLSLNLQSKTSIRMSSEKCLTRCIQTETDQGEINGCLFHTDSHKGQGVEKEIRSNPLKQDIQSCNLNPDKT